MSRIRFAGQERMSAPISADISVGSPKMEYGYIGIIPHGAEKASIKIMFLKPAARHILSAELM